MNVYNKIGVKPVINAYGVMTFLGGSRMAPEVTHQYAEAAKNFVNLWELHQAAGRIVAEIMGVEVGLVTAGCAASMAMGVASCIAKRSGVTDPEKLRDLLPHCDTISNEVLIAKSHRNMYNQAFEVGGARLVEFGEENSFSDVEFKEAITNDTVAVAFQFRYGYEDSLTSAVEKSYYNQRRQNLKALKEVCDLAHEHNLPVIVDAAAEIPPRENFKKIVATGADLICLSGGKDIMGPNDSGFLFGRKDLMVIAHLLSAPNQQVARSMKIGREGIIAAVTALQRYVNADETKRFEKWEERVQYWIKELKDIPNVRVERMFPKKGERAGQAWPRANVIVDEKALNTTAAQIVWELSQGEPSIYVAYFRIYIQNGEVYLAIRDDYKGQNSFMLNPNHVTDEEVKMVARRVREVLLNPPKASKISPNKKLT